MPFMEKGGHSFKCNGQSAEHNTWHLFRIHGILLWAKPRSHLLLAKNISSLLPNGISLNFSKHSRTQLCSSTSNIKISKPLASRIARLGGIRTHDKRGVSKYLTKIRLGAKASRASLSQELFWHTLWNILVHRCEGLTETPA